MFNGDYDELMIKADFYEHMPRDYYWDESTYPNDHKYTHMELEDFMTERSTIFQEWVVALDNHLKV